jgi:hypothetical protein
LRLGENNGYIEMSGFLVGRLWGRSLGRYDDGLQNVVTGLRTSSRDEEVLELSEETRRNSAKNTVSGKGRRFKSDRPHHLASRQETRKSGN